MEQRCQVLQVLAELPHLRCLDLEVCHDRELGIIAELSNLRELNLVMKRGCTALGARQLLKMKEQRGWQLQVLEVMLWRSRSSEGEWERLRATGVFDKLMISPGAFPQEANDLELEVWQDYRY
jgi:hypothetical protein